MYGMGGVMLRIGTISNINSRRQTTPWESSSQFWHCLKWAVRSDQNPGYLLFLGNYATKFVGNSATQLHYIYITCWQCLGRTGCRNNGFCLLGNCQGESLLRVNSQWLQQFLLYVDLRKWPTQPPTIELTKHGKKCEYGSIWLIFRKAGITKHESYP